MPGENFQISGAAIEVNGQSVGLLHESGATVTVSPDVHLHMSDKYPSAVAASITGRETTIEMNLGESTLANLKTALAGSTGTGAELNLGGLAGTKLTPATIKLVPHNGTETWNFKAAVPTSEVEAVFAREDERIWTVTFTALVDTDEADAENVAYVS
jgi:hypothetical protein